MIVFLLLAQRCGLLAPSRRVAAAGRRDALRNTARVCRARRWPSRVGPAWSLLVPVAPPRRPTSPFPPSIEGWDGPSESCHGRWRPQYQTADLHQQREFSRGGYGRVRLHRDLPVAAPGQGTDRLLDPALRPRTAKSSRRRSARRPAARSMKCSSAMKKAPTGSSGIPTSWATREMRRGIAAQFSLRVRHAAGAPAASVYAISTSCVPDCAAARRGARPNSCLMSRELEGE